MRETCRAVRSSAGVGVGSGSSSTAGTGAAAGTAAAGRSAAAAVGGASSLGLGLFLTPGGLPRRFAAGFGSGSGSEGRAGGSAGGAGGSTSTVGGGGSAGAAADSFSSSGGTESIYLLAFIGRAGSRNSPVQVDAEADAGAAQVHHVPVNVRQPEAEVPQRDGPADRDLVVLVGAALHDVADAAVANDLGDDIVAQRPHRVGGVGQAAAAEVELRVGHHLHEGEDLEGSIHEAGAQQVVDALGRGGPGALRVIRRIRKFGAKLLIVQNGSVAVPGHADLVGLLHVGCGRKVAADPSREPRARVRSSGQLSPVQRAQGLIAPVQVAAPVGAQEGVGHPDLEH